MLDTVLEVLSKPSGIRRRKELVDLVDYFITLEFFNKLEKENGQESLIDCFKVMKIEILEKDEYVFKYGDFGDLFYIIMKGTVCIKVPKPVTIKANFDEYINYLVQNYDHLVLSKMNLEDSIINEINKRKQGKLPYKAQTDGDITEYTIWKIEEVAKVK